MTDGKIWDTVRLAQHATKTAHLPTLLVLFRSNSARTSERVSNYNVSVVMAHFAAAHTAAVLIINREDDARGYLIAVKGVWEDSLPPPPPMNDSLLVEECPMVSIQQLGNLPSCVYAPVATGMLTLQGNRMLHLDGLLNLEDGRQVVTQLSMAELEDVARAFLTRGNLPAWRNQLNRWLVRVNQDAEEQVEQATQQTSSGAHALLRRLQEVETPQKRQAITTELQVAVQQGALQAQEARESSRQVTRQPRAAIHAALAAVSALETSGMSATSLGRLSNRAARANMIDRNNLTTLASLNTENAPNVEDLVLHEEGPVALCLRSMDQVDHNTSDEALNEPLRIGQYPENAVFEPTVVALEIADRIEEMDASPLTRQRLSVCLPIVSLQDATNRQTVYERLCLVFMNELSMRHVWLIALSSILRTIETQSWADPDSTPTGRLLQWFAAQIMEHVVLPEGSRLSPNTSQPVNMALAGILRDDILTMHSSIIEASVILRLLQRFGAPAAFSPDDLRRSMLARIAVGIPQMHRSWLQLNANDPWADQGPSSLSALLSSLYETRVDSQGAHVAVTGTDHLVENMDLVLPPAPVSAVSALARSAGITLDEPTTPGLTLVVLATLERVTSPHVSSSAAVELVRNASAAAAMEMNPITAGTASAEMAKDAVRRRLAWARTPLHPLSPFTTPFGPSVFWFYSVDGTVMNMAEGFHDYPGENDEDHESFLLRLTEHLRENRGRLMARCYGTQDTGAFDEKTTTMPMYREMADEFRETPPDIDLSCQEQKSCFIHRVTQRIVGRSGVSAGNVHAERMERNIAVLLPSLLEATVSFPDVDPRAEPRPIPLIRRVELELGGRLPSDLGEPPEPIWVPVEDSELLETLIRVQQEQERARVNALRRRIRVPAADSPASEPPAPRGIDMGRFQRSITWYLRHGAQETRLDGYVTIQSVLDALGDKYEGATIDQVLEVAETDEKGRFSISEEDGILYIRANQGHTISTVDPNLLMTPIETAADIPVCLHGTYEDAFRNILRSGGLNRMQRQAIQMAVGLPDDPQARSGIRSNVEIVIYIDVERAMGQGLRFYRSENNVICCEGPIPVECFTAVVRLSDGSLVEF